MAHTQELTNGTRDQPEGDVYVELVLVLKIDLILESDESAERDEHPQNRQRYTLVIVR